MKTIKVGVSLFNSLVEQRLVVRQQIIQLECGGVYLDISEEQFQAIQTKYSTKQEQATRYSTN